MHPAPQADAEAARRAWETLDQRTRREVLENGRFLRPHPVPAVSAIAAQYAQGVLDRSSRVALLIQLLAPAVIYIVAVEVLTSTDTSGNRAGADLAVIGAGFFVCLAFALHAGVRIRRFRRLTRVRMANWLAPGVPETETPAPVREEPLAGEAREPSPGLAIRYATRRVVARLAGSAAAVAAAVGYLLFRAVSDSGPMIVFYIILLLVPTSLLLLMVAGQASLLLRWVLPGRPVVELDDRGAHFNVIAVTVPWPTVSEIRLFTLRSAAFSRPATVVGIVCAEPDIVAGPARLSRMRQRVMKRSARVYGTPFTFSDALTDQAAERVAETASQFAGVRVIRR